MMDAATGHKGAQEKGKPKRGMPLGKFLILPQQMEASGDSFYDF